MQQLVSLIAINYYTPILNLFPQLSLIGSSPLLVSPIV